MESASTAPSNEHASTTGSNANNSSHDPARDHVTEEVKDGKKPKKKKTSYRYVINIVSLLF